MYDNLDTPRGVKGQINRNTGQITYGAPVYTPENLAKVDPFKLPATSGTSAGSNLGITASGVANSATTPVAPVTPAPTTTTETPAQTGVLDYLKEIIGVQAGKGDFVAKEQKAQALDTKTQELNTINNEAITTAKSYDDQIKELQANKEGAFGGGLEQAINDLKRKKNEELANIGIRQAVAQGNVETAQKIIADKVAAKYEPLDNMVNYIKTFVQLNQADLTDSQKFALERKAKQEDERSSQLKSAYESATKAALDGGAPASIYSAIDRAASAPNATPASILAAAGQYGATGSDKVPTIKQINGVDMQWNPATGQWEQPKIIGGNTQQTLQLAQAQENVKTLSSLVNDKTIRTAVGPTAIARFVGRGFDSLTGGRQNFIASVEQIRSNLNLESLIQAKSRGATFGSLSDQELQVLASAASKIGSWAIKDKNGNVTGYNASEKDFKAELDKINNFAKLDYIIRGGDPIDVGAQMQNDGSIWVKNSDGTLSQIK